VRGFERQRLVIQRLFSIGMGLQGICHLTGDPTVVDRLERAVGAIDGTIQEIRATVFSIDTPETDEADGR
jgi:signal transduction histidine kinase